MCIVCAIEKFTTEKPDDEINKRILRFMDDLANHPEPINTNTLTAMIMTAMMVNVLIYKKLFQSGDLTPELIEILRNEFFSSLDMAKEETDKFLEELAKETPPQKPTLKIV